MTKNRPEVGDFLGIHARPVFSGSAAPVDTYVQAPLQKAPGDALLGALSKLDDAFSPVLKKEARKAAKREYDKGQELFQQNRTDFAEAVRSGKIPAGASPFVRRGYRESQLHVIGATYNVELQRAMEHSNIHEMSNPADVEEFIQAFNTKFSEANGLADMPQRELNKVFTPMAVRAHDAFRNKQAARNIEYVEDQRFRAFEAELFMAVSQGRFSGPEGSASADAKTLGQWIQSRAQEMYEEGLDYERIEKSILQAVGEVGVTNGSSSIAGILNGVSVGGMPPIGLSASGRKTARAIRKAASAREAARNRQATKESKAARKARLREIESDAQEAAREGDFDRAEELLTRLNEEDPTKARAVDGFIRRYRGDEEDAAQAGAFNDALAGVTDAETSWEAREVIDEAVVFHGLTPEDANKLEGIVQRRLEPAEGDDVLTIYEGDAYVKSTGKSIADRYPQTEFGVPVPENADQAARAQAFYEEEMLGWFSDNVNEDGRYDRLQARDAAQSARDAALELYGPQSDEDEVEPPEDTGGNPTPEWAQ